MIHLGDITKISGYEVPIVDCIVGGSPCQDLSVAGKRAGLEGERSGLFMEQIRIVKEMREQDARRGVPREFIRPRYMVWENVPGAFSSNKGEDFRIVLEEIVKIVEPEANVPMPEKNKWPYSGILLGDGWSVAWRILDAQFWGTSSKPLPQRRRRIALVADFGGKSAPEILFVRKSVSGNSEPSEPKRKEAARDVGESIGRAEPERVTVLPFDTTQITSPLNYSSPKFGDPCHPLAAGQHPPAVIYKADDGSTSDVSPTLVGDHNNRVTDHTALVVEPTVCLEGNGQRPSHRGDGWAETDKMYTLNTIDRHAVAYAMQGFGDYKDCGVASGLKQRDYKDATDLVVEENPIVLDRAFYNQGQNAKYEPQFYEDGTVPTLVAKGPAAVCAGVDAYNQTITGNVAKSLTSIATDSDHIPCVLLKHIVRRLTPLECERLQGYPDGWTDIGEWIDSKGKKHKEADSPRYKALGNSIALPPWKWVLKRLCACYERDATMASLFDGIGGFPLIWEQLNGKGSCLWASEIDEFPMAVTKLRFGE